jgi:hypothetical protein
MVLFRLYSHSDSSRLRGSICGAVQLTSAQLSDKKHMNMAIRRFAYRLEADRSLVKYQTFSRKYYLLRACCPIGSHTTSPQRTRRLRTNIDVSAGEE